MNIDFSKLFHRSSKDTSWGGKVRIPADWNQWPDEWKRTEYKTYSALPRVQLPATSETVEGETLFSIIKKRLSSRSYAPKPVSVANLSTLLRFSCGETGGLTDSSQRRRAQPSGGARFPLETYLLIFKPQNDVPAGIYHYSVMKHELVRLWEHSFTKEEIGKLYPYPWVADAAGVVILTAVFDRTKRKYGERGYRYSLLEAGHIGQNLYLVSTSLGLGCCAVLGSNDEALEALLDIDGESESVVYSFVFGHI